MTAAIFGIGALASAVAPSPTVLIVSRVFLGLAIGLASTNVSCASAGARLGCIALSTRGDHRDCRCVSDRLRFRERRGLEMDVGLSVAPALVFGTGMFFLPETPRWLMHGGHHEVARRVLVRIRELADVNVEIDEIKASLAQQAESGHWTDLLRRQVRPALVVGLGLTLFSKLRTSTR